jgi:hypothetical protein
MASKPGATLIWVTVATSKAARYAPVVVSWALNCLTQMNTDLPPPPPDESREAIESMRKWRSIRHAAAEGTHKKVRFEVGLGSVFIGAAGGVCVHLC